MEGPLKSKSEEPEPKKTGKLTRREFLRKGGVVAGLVGMSFAAGRQMPDPKFSGPMPRSSADIEAGLNYQLNPALSEKKARLEREHANIAKVESPNASYRIAYNVHSEESSTAILEGSDALILELVGDNPINKDEAFNFLQASVVSTDYKKLVIQAVKQKKPIFFIDYNNQFSQNELENQKFFQDKSRSDFIKTLEIFLGGSLILTPLMMEHAEPISRRNFLQKAGKAGLGVVGVYLLSHTPEKALDQLAFTNADIKNEKSLVRKTQKAVGTMNAVLHPETRSQVIDMRNTLMAQKAETVARVLSKELGRKPRIAIEIGAAHFGIEHELRRSENSRLGTLQRDLGDRLKDQSLIARIDSSPDNKWEITISEDLAMLARAK